MDVLWRPITRDDVPAWNELLAAAEAVDRTGEHFDEADLCEELDDPAAGPRDRTGGWQGDQLVTYAAVLPRANPVGYLRLHGEGTTHPQCRGTGLGGQALAWMRRRAAEIPPEKGLALDAHLEIVAFLDNPAQLDLLETHGFEAVNWSALMRAPLDTGANIPEPHWPDGLLLRDYDASWSAPMREAHNEAFVDHWGFTAWSAEEWRQRVDASKNFRPDMSWIVVDEAADPDVVVGYVQTNEFEANQAATQRREAFLAKLGVRRSHRGRGLATALLRHALWAYRAVGYDESALDVDTDDPTGAFRLYERIGYRVEARTVTHQFVVPALSR